MKSSSLLAFAGTLVLVAVPSIAQQPPPKLVAAIDGVVADLGITDKSPGIAVLIVQPLKWTFHKGYGLANQSTGAEITQSTLFELASLSKPFTAIAILKLHERRALSLDDDVRRHLPELPQYAPDAPVRMRDMLQHVSGLPDYLSFENVPAAHQDYWTSADYLAPFADQKSHPLFFPTGQKYKYENSNYMLLGLVVERVSGKPYSQFLREEVFLPAGMNHTFVYDRPDAVPADLPKPCVRAVGYSRKMGGGWRDTWGTRPDRQETMLSVGDGGVWSNLVDLGHWDAALRENTLLKPATLQMSLQPSQTRNGKTNQYGLGWSLYPNPNRPGRLFGYGHDGRWNGFRTS